MLVRGFRQTEEATLAIPAAIPAGAKAAPAATGIPTLPILAMISPIVAQPSVSGKELFAMREASSMSFSLRFPIGLSRRVVCLFRLEKYSHSLIDDILRVLLIQDEDDRRYCVRFHFVSESSLFCSWDSVLL